MPRDLLIAIQAAVLHRVASHIPTFSLWSWRRVWGIHHSHQPKEYFPLTGQVIHDHLTGKLTAGVYPLLTDETCWFLATDFDKATWQEDVEAFLYTCGEWQVPSILERSRSGCGGHVWIFFEAPLPASLARTLGAHGLRLRALESGAGQVAARE